MKRSFFAVTILAVAAAAFAGPLDEPAHLRYQDGKPPQKRTIDLQRTPDGRFSLVVLSDGNKGYGGIAFTPSTTNGKLSYGALAVTDMSGKSLYVGALAQYEVYRKGDWVAGLDVGFKGLDLASLTLGDGGHQAVFGFSLKGKL
jgi:hypothetical protein